MAFVFAMLRHSDLLTYTTSGTIGAPEGAGLVGLDVPALRSSRNAGIMQRRGAWLSPAAQAVIAQLKAICKTEPDN